LVRSSSSMQPSGVQGTNSGSRPCVLKQNNTQVKALGATDVACSTL
jgi:hypothetical protein